MAAADRLSHRSSLRRTENRRHRRTLEAIFAHPSAGAIRWGDTMIEYKGYLGIFDFEPDSGSFHGTVVNTNDVISFYGSSVAELRKEMRRSVEEYLAFCREQDRPPEKPFSGKLMLRTTPELHRKVALQAARRRLSMNAWLQQVLERAVAGD